MNHDVIESVLRRAHELGEQEPVLAVLAEADEFTRVGLPRYVVSPMQATYLLTRSTDLDLDVAVRDLLTTAATAIALSWRGEVYASQPAVKR